MMTTLSIQDLGRAVKGPDRRDLAALIASDVSASNYDTLKYLKT